jgi:septal ring factor EnvC (AmiA/AmiB activator)
MTGRKRNRPKSPVSTALALVIGCVGGCAAAVLPACGVSSATHSATLQHVDQLQRRLEQADATVRQQRQQLAELQRAEQQMKDRLAELETQTADQTVSVEALTQRLQAVMAERDELLLQIADLRKRLDALASSSSPGPSDPPPPPIRTD